MQHITTRNGCTDWVSDGEPSDQAVDAALLSEMARRIGMDWHEADAELQNHAPDDDEAQAATEQALSFTDNDLVRELLRMMAARRAELARYQAARLMQMTARDLMEPAK
jgi:hypothetical protein